MAQSFGIAFEINTRGQVTGTVINSKGLEVGFRLDPFFRGDVNVDHVVDLLDVEPFV